MMSLFSFFNLEIVSSLPSAIRVWGQNGNFTSMNGGTSQSLISLEIKICPDNSGGLFISDGFNNRILYFASNDSNTAQSVLGQPNFTMSTNAENNYDSGNYYQKNNLNGGIGILGPKDLRSVEGIVFDPIIGGIYVSDSSNSRVLYFPNMTSNATKVWGQLNQFNKSTMPVRRVPVLNNVTTVTANTLSLPKGIAIDSFGGLYIADNQVSAGGGRILYYKNGNTTAERVYGQNGDMNAIRAFYENSRNGDYFNDSAIVQNTLNKLWFSNQIFGIAVDKYDGLYVADMSFNRVLYFEAGNSLIPKRVYGQKGNLSTIKANLGKSFPSADSLFNPYSVAVDSNLNVYIADKGNNRVLVYEGESTTATGLYGQESFDFTQTPLRNKTTANTFFTISSIAIGNGLLYVGDETRVVAFQLPPPPLLKSASSSSSEKPDLPIGAIVGLSIGIVVILIMIWVFLYYKCR